MRSRAGATVRRESPLAEASRSRATGPGFRRTSGRRTPPRTPTGPTRPRPPPLDLRFREQAGTLRNVEETDREIVRLLARDGRMSYTDLARATGLSTSAVHQRVRRLEQRGVIRGYTAVVAADAVGLPLTAFISVTPLDPAAPDDAAQRLSDLPEIEACHSVAGEESYILKVRVASPGALEDLLSRVRLAANVRTRTTVVLSTPYESRPPAI